MTERSGVVQRRAVTSGDAPTPAGSPSPSASSGGGAPLPDGLKAGLQHLSGLSMDDVSVHHGSAEPARLGAKAYAQGSEIHLGPGQEKHLPHEAWHVVQQRQGMVPATESTGGVPINSDPALEDDADKRGAAAAAHTAAPTTRAAAPASPGLAPGAVQLIKVDDDDIGEDFDITTNDGERCIGTLKSINGGGWYTFTVDGEDRAVRGQDNIHGRSNAMDLGSSGGGPSSGGSDGEGSDGENSIDEHSDMDDEINEVDITNYAREHGVSRKTALAMLRESFRRNPRTVRVHTGFGMKTIFKGGPAYDSPQETSMAPQAMVGYRQGDYGKHKKVGTDYDEWAEELSGSSSDEDDKRDRARLFNEGLDGNDELDIDDLSARKRAAFGGMMLVTHVSDPLRIDAESERVPHDFREVMRQRERGETSLMDAIGDKDTSTFLPARGGGSGQERARLLAEQEVCAQILVRINNCLIRAIADAAGHVLTLAELVTIRVRLGSIGNMLVATAPTVNTILDVLQLGDRGVIVHYTLNDGGLNEDLGDQDDDDPLEIFHTGADHFTANCPDPNAYHLG